MKQQHGVVGAAEGAGGGGGGGGGGYETDKSRRSTSGRLIPRTHDDAGSEGSGIDALGCRHASTRKAITARRLIEQIDELLALQN